MKTTAFFQKSLTAIVVAGLLFTAACKKSDNSGPVANPATADEAQQSIEDNSMGESYSTDAQNMADQTAAGTQHFRKGGPEDDYTFSSPCATVTKDTVNKIVTIDFGSSFCLCKDGRYRKGIINIKHSGGNFYTTPGAKREITYTNFHVGRDTINKSHQVEGTHTLTFKGLNSANHLNWDIAANMKFTKDQDPTIFHSWTSNRNREWFSGDNTPFDWTDDVFHITGSTDGNNCKGKSFHAQITTPLERAMGCDWFRSGVYELTPAGKATRTIDYGNNGGQANVPDGGCDQYATFSINGKSYLITLP